MSLSKKLYFLPLLLLILLLFLPVFAPATSICKANMSGFTLTGDPTSVGGATWAYVSTDDGVYYNLTGILFKPVGSGPFPGIIASNGKGGPAPVDMAKEMVKWDAVVIGPIYTHALNYPQNSPASGSPTGLYGASTANLQRAHKAWDILCGLGYVDMNRVAAHGHSMGAFVTSYLMSNYPDDFIVASHTAGGIVKAGVSSPWPSSDEVQGIRDPYQMHHGDMDTTVPLRSDQLLDGVLTTLGVIHELHVYPGYVHSAVKLDATVLSRIKDWYTTYGLFTTTPANPAASAISFLADRSILGLINR